MGFDEEKMKVLGDLGKKDKSKKGSLDEKALPIIQAINAHPDYYTTSSCSGRIYFIERNEFGKKNETQWIYASHNLISKEDLFEACKKISAGTIWFRQEGPILHIACKDIASAEKMLQCARNVGYKRAGAFNLQNKIFIEVIATENIEVPIADEGKMLVDNSYIEYLGKLANTKLEKSWKTLTKFEEAVKKMKEK
jgi:tRNA wybutosine-synthesizing protein 3